MATFDIKMPKLGESITEGTIMSWFVKAGDTIEENDVLFEVNTAKVSAEVPSPVAGKILKILFEEGDTVEIGQVVVVVEIEGEVSDSEEIAESPKEDSEVKEIVAHTNESLAETNENNRFYSPVVLQKIQEANISKEELDKLSGSGEGGRVTKKDIEQYIAQRKSGTSETTQQEVQLPATNKPVPEKQFSSEDEIIEMDVVRRTIADHMVLSKKTSAHVTTVVEVDVTKLVHWREHHKEEFQHREGINLTFMPAIVEATTKALTDFPRVNSSVEGARIIQKKRINIGVAVSLNDGNLVVPVIKDADKLSFSGLALSVDSLVAKARQNKLTLDEVQEGTFTITNYGSFKNIIATPIINQPQVAILGVGYIEKKPAVVETPEGDMIAIRHKMYLSLSFDHRIIDGALGGMFLKRIADYLEHWEK